MHIHILGICGTFMAGIAMLAKDAGFEVSGSDQNVYPPMSDELARAGITIHEGYDAAQLDSRPDLVVVGNVMKRGMEVVERLLDERWPYISGPQWLHDHYLAGKQVLAVAGTHGKTTTTSMLAWILECAGLKPSFLIGGLPGNFPRSARNTQSPYFVIEADEYDSAFFDKRSKFIHYSPHLAIINNLEYDHADIFDSIEDIKKQFHFLIRTIPSHGCVVYNDGDDNVYDVIKRGLWSEDCPVFSRNSRTGYQLGDLAADFSSFKLLHKEEVLAEVKYRLTGAYNARNAAMAMIAASKVGVPFEVAAQAMQSFVLPRRRMEFKGRERNVSVYDDFAHHPTAIAQTIEGLRARLGPQRRLIAVFEPRSNSMRIGAHLVMLPPSFEQADLAFIYAHDDATWNARAIFQPFANIRVINDFDWMIEEIVRSTGPEASVITMSNGSFNNITLKLLHKLRTTPLEEPPAPVAAQPEQPQAQAQNSSAPPAAGTAPAAAQSAPPPAAAAAGVPAARPGFVVTPAQAASPASAAVASPAGAPASMRSRRAAAHPAPAVPAAAPAPQLAAAAVGTAATPAAGQATAGAGAPAGEAGVKPAAAPAAATPQRRTPADVLAAVRAAAAAKRTAGASTADSSQSQNKS